MTPRRLLDDPQDDFESTLLGSACIDVPDDRTVVRGVVAIAAAAGTLSAGGTAMAAVNAAAVKAAAVPSAAPGLVGPALVAKWLGVGAVVGTLATGTGAYVTHVMDAPQATVRTEPSAPAPRASRQAPAPARGTPQTEAIETPPALPPAAPASEPVPARAGDVRPLVPRPEDPGTASVAPLLTDTPTAEALTVGVEALSRARVALGGRDPVRALSELRQYEITRRTHVLDEEALMLRLEALLQLGQAPQARDLARKHLAGHPASAHRARLREIAEPSIR
jgi:hypothetical protein